MLYHELHNAHLVASDSTAGEMQDNVMASGGSVSDMSIWNGPVPDDSFTYYASGVRMSTAEYFFLRRANQLSLPEAVMMGVEMCGKFRTNLTDYENDGSDYDFLNEPRTRISNLYRYLSQIADTEEGMKALKVLSFITEGCATPFAAYFYTMLSLPACYGGYELSAPDCSKVEMTYTSFAPSSSSRFIAYDLYWGNKRAAVQYTGETAVLGLNEFRHLSSFGIHVVPVSKYYLEDEGVVDFVAHRVAELIGETLPNRTDEWVHANEELRKMISVPSYEHMEMTYRSLMLHR